MLRVLAVNPLSKNHEVEQYQRASDHMETMQCCHREIEGIVVPVTWPVVTHELDFVSWNCDRHMVLGKVKICFFGRRF